MNKIKLIIGLLSVMIFTSCFQEVNKIMIWTSNDNESFEIANIRSLTELNNKEINIIFEIPLTNFSQYDNLFKTFYFKSQEDAEKTYTKLIEKTYDLHQTYFFSIAKKNEIIMNGLYVPSISSIQRNDDLLVHLLFTEELNLRLAKDPTIILDSFPGEAELIDTTLIENLIPVKYDLKKESNIIKIDTVFYIILDNKTIIKIDKENNEIKNLSIKDNSFTENLNITENFFHYQLTNNLYSEKSLFQKNDDKENEPCITKNIMLGHNKKIKFAIDEDGAIYQKNQNE